MGAKVDSMGVKIHGISVKMRGMVFKDAKIKDAQTHTMSVKLCGVDVRYKE